MGPILIATAAALPKIAMSSANYPVWTAQVRGLRLGSDIKYKYIKMWDTPPDASDVTWEFTPDRILSIQSENIRRDETWEVL